jgi:sugar/nucleoside kinase (ribokinase family)
MNAAIVLGNLGLSTKIGGPRFGTETESVLSRYAQQYDIDVSSVTTDSGYPGVTDLVIVDDRHRTVFGSFGAYFDSAVHRWDEPDPAGIAAARVVSIDPYFGVSSERAATLALGARKPYVTIDCPFDGVLHANAAATVVSREYRRQAYPGFDEQALFAEYLTSSGLTIFTAGPDDVRYGRPGQAPGSFAPFRLETVSTLGAGDVFRAGIVHGLYRELDDAQMVAFASALAAVACRAMPIADHPPSLAAAQALLASRGD